MASHVRFRSDVFFLGECGHLGFCFISKGRSPDLRSEGLSISHPMGRSRLVIKVFPVQHSVKPSLQRPIA